MTGYNDSTAYAFDLFEPAEPRRNVGTQSREQTAKPRATRSSVAPKLEPKPKKNIVPLKKVTVSHSTVHRAENRQGNARVTSILVFLLVVSVALTFQITALIKQNDVIIQIAKMEANIEELKSENVRLNSELNGITGIGVVENYATNILGMTKAEKGQVKCIDLSEGDKVLYSSQSQILSALSLKGESDKGVGGKK